MRGAPTSCHVALDRKRCSYCPLSGCSHALPQGREQRCATVAPLTASLPKGSLAFGASPLPQQGHHSPPGRKHTPQPMGEPQRGFSLRRIIRVDISESWLFWPCEVVASGNKRESWAMLRVESCCFSAWNLLHWWGLNVQS